MEQRKRLGRGHRIDYGILFAVALLCAFGLVMVFSASYYYAQNYSGVDYDGYHYLRKQIQFLAIGFPVMIAISFVPYTFYKRAWLLAYLGCVALLVLVLVIGKEANGAKRWLIIGGLSIQPSELAKFGMMMYMCAFMDKKHAVMHTFKKGMFPMLLVIGVTCGLVMLQPNMSMAVIIGLMGYGLLLAGGADWKQLIVLGIVCVGLFVLLAVIEPYRFARLTNFVDPWADGKNGLGAGYQLVQSFYALGSGGLFGRGLNNSRQKLLFMTYGESDFIFAILGEELGLVGALVVMAVYAFIVYRGFRVSLRLKDRFASLLATGISFVFALQVLVNIGVVTGSMPTTGQALPFISAGGTSLLIFLAAIGILLNLSRYTVEPSALGKETGKKHSKSVTAALKESRKKRSAPEESPAIPPEDAVTES